MSSTVKQEENNLKVSSCDSLSTMSSLISAIDTVSETSKQFGDNGHAEYSWSDNFKESISQFYFQLVRTSDKVVINNLMEKLSTMLNSYKSLSIEDQKKNYTLISTLYRMIAQTRDIVAGKGEYNLSYMQLVVWYQFYPELALEAVDRFVQFSMIDNKTHPFGSWKDLKYLANYVKEHEPESMKSNNSAFLQHIISLYYFKINSDWADLNYIYGREQRSVDQFKEYDSIIEYHMKNPPHDIEERIKYVGGNLSLVGKWCPRGSSKKFGWIFNEIAKVYADRWIATATTESSKSRALRKGMTHLRKILSAINRHIDTVQVKQCSKKWSDINFNKVTSITLHKQINAFKYINNMGVRRGTLDDRIKCSENYSAHLAAAVAGDKRHVIRGKRVDIGDIVKRAIRYQQDMKGHVASSSEKMIHEEIRQTINLQWDDNKSQNKTLSNMIAMVDTSGSMEDDAGRPLHTAIGLGVRIAELSNIGNRIMTFSASPTWVNLEQCMDFCEKVEIVRNCNWGMNTNIYSALRLILDACVSSRIPSEQVENMVLVILSDMQFDQGDRNVTDSMMESIDYMFNTKGYKKSPHICWWNLRSTSGFPTISSKKNTTMVSGFSPVLLNTFINKGIEQLKEITPWMMMQDIMSNSRYDEMEKYISLTMKKYWKESLFSDSEYVTSDK